MVCSCSQYCQCSMFLEIRFVNFIFMCSEKVSIQRLFHSAQFLLSNQWLWIHDSLVRSHGLYLLTWMQPCFWWHRSCSHKPVSCIINIYSGSKSAYFIQSCARKYFISVSRLCICRNMSRCLVVRTNWRMVSNCVTLLLMKFVLCDLLENFLGVKHFDCFYLPASLTLCLLSGSRLMSS